MGIQALEYNLVMGNCYLFVSFNSVVIPSLRMPETRSGRATPVDTNESDIISVIKEKFEELKADLLSEIEELINLEVEKAMKAKRRI